MPTMGVAIFLVGAILIGIAVARNLGDWRRARVAFDWPAARGEIVRSNRERWAKAALGMDSGTIDYVYRVGDETFTKHYRIPSDVPTWFARYPIGAMITVYYNPARPQEHRIPAQRVISNGAIYLYIAGFMIAMLGAAVILAELGLLPQEGHQPRTPRRL